MLKYLRYLLPLGYMAALFSVSSIPGNVMETDPAFRWITPNLQNLLHVPVFGGLALCWLWALKNDIPIIRNRMIVVLILTLIYAMVDESWQTRIPGRYGSFTDLLLDTVGAVLALWLVTHAQFMARIIIGEGNK